MPGLAVARRDDVDVTIENQGPLALLAEEAGHQDGLTALDLHPGKARMGFEPADVGVETVDLEAGFLQHQCHEVLHGPLLAGDRGYPNEVLRQPDTGTRVEGVQRFCDGRFSDHAAVSG